MLSVVLQNTLQHLWVCALQEEVFNYIHNILSMPGYSAEEKQLVWQKALDHIEVGGINPAPTVPQLLTMALGCAAAFPKHECPVLSHSC